MTQVPETIGVLSLGPIGDAVLTTPLLAALRDHFPEARITVIAGPNNSQVFALSRLVDDVKIIRNSTSGVVDSLGVARSERWDLYIDPKDHSSTTSRLLATIFRYETGLVHPPNLPPLRGCLIIPPADGPHFVDNVITPLLALDLEPPSDRRPILARTETGMEAYDVLLNISTGSGDRRWRVEYWKELTDQIWIRNRARIGIISSPEERQVAERIAEGRPAETVSTPALEDLFDVVARARLVVTPDTSLVHIASAFNVPVVALFSSNEKNMRRFAPLSDHGRVVQPEGPGGMIEMIRPEAVLREVEELIQQIDR